MKGVFYLFFSTIFIQIPDDSSSHLLAPVRQLSNRKQRSIHGCTFPAHRSQKPLCIEINPFPDNHSFSNVHFGWTPVWPCVFVEEKPTPGQWEEVAVSQPSLSVSVEKAWQRLTPACVIASITSHQLVQN